MAAIASLEFSACDSAVWVQCKVSNRFCFYRQILKRRLPDKNAKDQCAHRFVSIFHMRGQRTVELASQLRISVASDTWHISVISVFIPELSWIIYTSSTAQGGGGSFRNRKPIGEIGCCESGMAERSHWLTERWLELCLLEWLQWLQWSPHPQLLDVVWCTATVVVVVA